MLRLNKKGGLTQVKQPFGERRALRAEEPLEFVGPAFAAGLVLPTAFAQRVIKLLE
jgi:hypothetical protein